MTGINLDWSVPFNSDDIGKQAMFVWIQSKELAEEFINNYRLLGDKASWIRRWNSYGTETIYAIPRSGDSWMYGDRASLSESYLAEGYVPRLYLGETPIVNVEVGDLL